MIVRPLIPQQSTVNGKRKVISRYENGGEAANTGIGKFSPTLDQIIAGATYDPQAFLDESRLIAGKGAVGTTVGVYGDMYEFAKNLQQKLFPGVPIDKILESLPYSGIAGLFKLSKDAPTTKDVEDFAETLGIDVPREDIRYKAGQFLPVATALGAPATMVGPQMLTGLGKYTDKIKKKAQEFFDNLGFGEETLDTGIGVFVPTKDITVDEKGSNIINAVILNPQETGTFGTGKATEIDYELPAAKNITKGAEELQKKGKTDPLLDTGMESVLVDKSENKTYLEKDYPEMVESYVKDPMASINKAHKYRDIAQADVNTIQKQMLNIANDIEKEKKRLYSKYQPQVKKYATLNPEIERQILTTVLDGLEPIENLKYPTFKLKIYDVNTDSMKALTNASVDNTGKSLEDLQKNIIEPLLKDLEKLDETAVKQVTPLIDRTPPFVLNNENPNQVEVSLDGVDFLLSREAKKRSRFTDTANVPKTFGQTALDQKIIATRGVLEDVIKNKVYPNEYIGKTIDDTNNVSKNLMLDTFASKYQNWLQNTAATDVLVKGKDGRYKQEKYVDPQQGFGERKNVNIKQDVILKSLVDGKIQFDPKLLKETLKGLNSNIRTYIDSIPRSAYIENDDLASKVRELQNFNKQIDTYLKADEPNFNTIFKQSETPKARAERKQKLIESQIEKNKQVLKDSEYEEYFIRIRNSNEKRTGLKEIPKSKATWEKDWEKDVWNTGLKEKVIANTKEAFEKSFPKSNAGNRILFTILDSFYNEFAYRPQIPSNVLTFSIAQFIKGKDPFVVGYKDNPGRLFASEVPVAAYPKNFFPDSKAFEEKFIEKYRQTESIEDDFGFRPQNRVVKTDLGNINPRYKDTDAIYSAPKKEETIGPSLSAGKLVDDETFLKNMFDEQGNRVNTPGKYANSISSTGAYPDELISVLRVFQNRQKEKAFLKTNPEFLETYKLYRNKTQKKLDEIENKLKKEGKEGFESEQVKEFLKDATIADFPVFTNIRAGHHIGQPTSTIFKDLETFFGIEEPQIYKYFKNLSKQDAEKLAKEPFDKIVADMIEKIQKSPTINKSFAKEGVYLNLIDYKNPNNLKLPSGRGFVEIDNSFNDTFKKFVEKNKLPLEIVQNKKGRFIPIDTETGYSYRYFSSFAGSEGKKSGIHSVKPSDDSRGIPLVGKSKEEVATNIKLALMGEKLRNCIGSQCKVDGINSKLFVLTSKQNKEPYFAIKLTKDNDGTWRTDSGSFLGFQNKGLGSSEFVFPPELRDLPSVDKNAEMIRDIIQGLNNFTEKGNALSRANILGEIEKKFSGDDMFSIYQKYPELNPNTESSKRLYKFKDGGEVRGVGSLNHIARNMFKQPRGVVTLSSVARNMFI